MSQQNKTFGETLAEQRRGPDYKADNWREQADEYRKGKQKTAPPSGRGHPLLDLLGYAQGGMVKKGSYTTPQMCSGGKVIKSWGK